MVAVFTHHGDKSSGGVDGRKSVFLLLMYLVKSHLRSCVYQMFCLLKQVAYGYHRCT